MKHENRVYLIGGRVFYDKEAKTFVIARSSPQYQIYMDEFAQMVYVAMQNGAFSIELIGHDKDEDSPPMRLRTPKDDTFEGFLTDENGVE